MASFTTRLGLTKPAGTEARSVTPLNTNADLIDKFLPCILVNDGVTPPTGDLYDGALVKERTSGIIWEARKNGGGTYDKVYVRYPFHIQAFMSPGPINAGSTTVYTQWGELNAVTASACKNASIANLGGPGGGKFVAPVKGIYKFKLAHQWQASGAGIRGLATAINGTTTTGEYEKLETPNGSFNHIMQLEFTILMNVNDSIGAAGWQNSGGTIQVTGSWLRAALIEPCQ